MSTRFHNIEFEGHQVIVEDNKMHHLAGQDYLGVLKQFHTTLRPKNYLEIGTRDGPSLALATCPSIAIDPNFVLNVPPAGQRTQTFFFQITSDDFFATQNPTRLFGMPIQMAFLDGLHQYEFLLRDFINTEKHCVKISVVFMHDVLPLDAPMAGRADTGGWWTGDVWKLILILKKYRPDIDLYCFDAQPTGLLVATNLDPSSHRLESHYSEIVKEWADVTLVDYGLDRLYQEAAICSTAIIDTPLDIMKRFWL